MTEVEKKHRELAEAILIEAKSRIYDLGDFKVERVEFEPEFLKNRCRSVLDIRLPNGDSLLIQMFTTKEKGGA